MCEMHATQAKQSTPRISTGLLLIIGSLCGIATGFLDIPTLNAAANASSEIFINLLKLVSLPIIFLSIVSTASGMASVDEVKFLGKKVVTYTLLTTILAAAVALFLFVVIDPVRSVISSPLELTEHVGQNGSYFDYLLHAIPSNFLQPFNENHVIGVLFLAMLLSLATLSLPDHHRSNLHALFSSLYAAVMKITTWIVKLMPIAIWAFVALFIKDMQAGLEVKSLALYLTCVVAANCIQALIVLPSILKWKGIPPLKTARGMLPALSVAFFTKSSSAAVPMAMRCASDNLGCSPKVAKFSLPLCTTINMNGCAAFILTTVLFVSMSNGVVFSGLELFSWIFIATIAAVGNAGVPMGCYFLSGAFLAAMNIPLNIMGVILPFYTLIDMLESAINVWSDSCVTMIVDKEAAPSPAAASTALETTGAIANHGV